jgi:hypothetical protein
MTPILSEYQETTRNAKIYRDPSGRFAVIVFDAADDYNDYASFDDINSAEDYAEDWVLRAGR